MLAKSNNNKGMFVSVGNQSAISQRTKANFTPTIFAYFMFGNCDANGVQGGNLNHTVKISGWFSIQQMENRLKDLGCSVVNVTPISGTGIFYCIK
jgi:hypothetical protein